MPPCHGGGRGFESRPVRKSPQLKNWGLFVFYEGISFTLGYTLVTMKHYVYIIYSKRLDIYYKGYSLNPKNRLLEHNSNFSAFTAHKGPWKIVFFEIFMIKSKALNREKSLKKYDHQQLLKLINSNANQLNFYLDSCLWVKFLHHFVFWLLIFSMLLFPLKEYPFSSHYKFFRQYLLGRMPPCHPQHVGDGFESRIQVPNSLGRRSAKALNWKIEGFLFLWRYTIHP